MKTQILARTVLPQIMRALQPQKVVVILGPRRVGKTVLLKQLADQLHEEPLFLNGEDMAARELLQRRSIANYKALLGKKRLLFIDEAQKIEHIGAILKLMVDEIEGIRIVATGSSAFDLEQNTGEPLTGRKKSFRLFALSEGELNSVESEVEKKDALTQRLVLGNYPELFHISDREDKVDYLREIVESYLLKDILSFEQIAKSDKILGLLRLLAFQVGKEVSHNELGQQLGMSKNTVDKYLDLLAKVYIIQPVGGFSRNLRKEVSKSKRYYFLDNGIRNILAANMNPVDQRRDIGEIWENYLISERLKLQSYQRKLSYNYYWRTYDQQEIDWVEEREGQLFGYEFKWNPRKSPKAPAAWRKAYPNAHFEVITSENYREWLELDN